MKIKIKVLKALNLFTSKDTSRRELCGIHVAFEADGIFLNASNGHYAAIIRQNLDTRPSLTFGLIIPSTLINKIQTDKFASDLAELAIEGDDIIITYRGSIYRESQVHGGRLDMRQIIPATTSGQAAQFNLDYLRVFQKAGKLLGAKGGPVIDHNGDEPGFVTWFMPHDGLQGCGVIMPVRAKFTQTRPSWASHSAAQAA